MIKPKSIHAALGSLLLAVTAHAQTGHLEVGAVGKNQGDPLTFLNGDIYGADSGYRLSLNYATSGRYAGYYQGNLTLVAAAATDANGEDGHADPGAAALGSFLKVGLVSVTGPAGGSFGYWDSTGTAPLLSYSVGYQVPDTSAWMVLSSAALGAGAVGADPFGHLHGRRFTATIPGDYLVGFKAYDTSVNGAEGSPIHTPSDTLLVKFTAQAVPEPGTMALGITGTLALGIAGFLRRR